MAVSGYEASAVSLLAELSSAGTVCGAQSVLIYPPPPGVRRMPRWSADAWATVEPSTPFCRAGECVVDTLGTSFCSKPSPSRGSNRAEMKTSFVPRPQ